MHPIDQIVPPPFFAALGLSPTEEVPTRRYALRRMSVLFADLLGYTKLSAALDAPALLGMLNDVFEHVVPPIHAAGGFVDKFMGDTVMALFEGPSDGALLAAKGMRDGLAKLNATWTADGRAPLESTIGIHTGDVALGVVGCPERVAFTAIGEAVNTAARVQGLAGKVGSRVLLTDSVVAALQSPARFSLRLVDPAAHLKGLATPLAVHELL